MKDTTKLARAATTARFGVEVGCHDGGCIFGHPGGMQTNGGCRCRDEMGSHMRLSVLFKEAVEREATLRADVERLTKELESRREINASDLDMWKADNARHLEVIETLRAFVMRVAPELSRQSGEASNLVLDAADYAKKADEVESR